MKALNLSIENKLGIHVEYDFYKEDQKHLNVLYWIIGWYRTLWEDLWLEDESQKVYK